MRIAMFTDVFPRLSNTFILNQITGLLDRGHQVDIFARARGDFEHAHDEVARYRLADRMRHIPIPQGRRERLTTAIRHLAHRSAWNRGTLNAFNPRLHRDEALSLVQLYTALSFMPQRRYDVVHCQFGKLGPTLLPLIAARGYREPLVTSFRGADLTRLATLHPGIYRELFRRGNLFLPVSASFRERLIDLGCPAERIVVHHSGVMVERFPFAERRVAAGEQTRLLFIGRLTEKKGLVYALEAVAEVLASGRRLELTVIGDGEQRAELHRHAQRLGIEESVVMAGRQTQAQVICQLQRSHLLVAPSVTASDGDQEGIPNVLKEAMATGIPVLATRHSGIPELVDHGVNGFLVPERDAGALAERLAHLIDNSESWPALGRAGRAKVEAEFDSGALNDELVRLYRGVGEAGTNTRAA
ncbi:MAG: glycosyltransferase [Trueperaceae bacterium]